MNSKQIIQQVQDITPVHMEMDIDIEAVLRDDFAGAERLLAVYLVQAFYRRFVERLGKDANKAYLRKAFVQSKWFAIKRLTQELPPLLERSSIFMLDEAKHSGWFVDLEYETIEELLSSMYDPQDSPRSTRSDYSFIVDSILPAARRFGLPTDDIIGASVQTKKLRGMVPHVRELLNRNVNGISDDEETADTLKWMFSVVGDPKVSHPEMKDRFYEWEGKKKETKVLIGYQMQVSSTQTYMLVPCNGGAEQAMVEQALRNTVNFELRGMDFLLELVTKKFKKTELDLEGL